MNETLGQFIESYPRKDDETAIWLEWNRQVFNGAKPEDILAGTRAWIAYWQTELTPTQFIPKPTSFLRRKTYLDIPTKSKGKTWSPPAVPTRRWTAAEANEPILSKPLSVAAYEPPEPVRGFRSAADILAARRASRGS